MILNMNKKKITSKPTELYEEFHFGFFAHDSKATKDFNMSRKCMKRMRHDRIIAKRHPERFHTDLTFVTRKSRDKEVIKFLKSTLKCLQEREI